MDAYGVAGLERFFGYNHRGFYESCVVRSNSHYYSSQAEIQLNIQRPFLDNDGQRQLLSWLEEYIYYYEPDKYLDLTTAILQSDSVSRLYEGAELRKLFDAVITRLDLPHYCPACTSSFMRLYSPIAKIRSFQIQYRTSSI